MRMTRLGLTLFLLATVACHPPGVHPEVKNTTREPIIVADFVGGGPHAFIGFVPLGPGERIHLTWPRLREGASVGYRVEAYVERVPAGSYVKSRELIFCQIYGVQDAEVGQLKIRIRKGEIGCS
jgi:hypothetical protein